MFTNATVLLTNGPDKVMVGMFTNATVLLTNGPDKVMVGMDYPCPIIPLALPSQPALTVSFDATYDTGADYCRYQLGIEPTIVNCRI